MNDFIKRFYLFTYKSLSLTFFSILLAVVVGYSSIVLFYLASDSWGTPLVLSPSQSKVLTFQPQVANLVLNINKQKAELSTVLQTKKSILEQLIEIDTLAIKIEETAKNEKNRSSYSSGMLTRAIGDKRIAIKQTEETLAATRELKEQTDRELKAGLITADQAAQRKITIQSATNSFVDMGANTTQLEVQATQLRDYSQTLGGSTRSLLGLAPAKQMMELNATKSQLKLQLSIGERQLDVLQKSMAADNRILQVAMDSPYYMALFQPTPVMFIPYSNIEGVKRGDPVYDCLLQIILCRQVGVIDRVFDAEEYAKHPIFRTDLKGRFATITLTNKDSANSQVLFVGSKPLFI